MLRQPVLLATLAASLFLAPGASAQQRPLDLIPDDASFGLVVRNLAEVRDKGEKFFADNDVNTDKAPRPTRFFRDVLNWLRIKEGLDEKGSVALVLPSLKKLGLEKIDPNNLGDLIQILMNLVVVIPVDDFGKMAGNFDLQKRDLVPGKVREVSRGRFVLAQDKYLLFGFKEKSVRLVANRRPLGAALGTAQKEALAGTDVVLHLGAEAWGKVYQDLLDNLRSILRLGEGKVDNEVIRHFVEALGKGRFVVGGLAIGKEGRIDVVASFQKGKDGAEALKFLSALRGGPGASDLVGLPAVHPLVAYAAKGDGVRNVHMARALLRVLLDKWLGIEVHLGYEGRKKFLDSFEVMYRHLKGSRAVIYRTSLPRQDRVGRLAAVVILDVDDTDAHLKRWETLVEVANAAAPKITRQDRTSSPRFAFKPKAEIISGAPVDWLTVEVPGLKAEVQREYKRLLGPDWNKVRLAVQGKSVVGLFGSDVETLKQTLANLKEGKKGLAEHPPMTAALRRLSAERKVELHFNLRDWLPLQASGISGLPDDPPPVKDLTSLALTVEEDRIGLQIRSSGEEQKQIVRLLGLGKE